MDLDMPEVSTLVPLSSVLMVAALIFGGGALVGAGLFWLIAG